MTTLIAEVYDAFREAGASEGKSRAAAEALSLYEDRFVSIDRRFDGLDHQIDLFRADVTQRFEHGRADSNLRFDQLRAESNQRTDAVRSDLSVRIERVEGRLNLVQWQLALVIGGIVALIIRAFFSGVH